MKWFLSSMSQVMSTLGEQGEGFRVVLVPAQVVCTGLAFVKNNQRFAPLGGISTES
jgi:hypothetical protein